MIRCTNCKELNQLESNFCSFCGYRLNKGLKQRLRGSKESIQIDIRLLIEIMNDTSNNRISFGDFKSKIALHYLSYKIPRFIMSKEMVKAINQHLANEYPELLDEINKLSLNFQQQNKRR